MGEAFELWAGDGEVSLIGEDSALQFEFITTSTGGVPLTYVAGFVASSWAEAKAMAEAIADAAHIW